MKKVLLILIAAAVGAGIYLLMQQNKMPAAGQSSEIAPITSDTMTPATDTTTPADTNATKTDSAPAADTTAPADNGTIPPCPSTPDNSTPGTMMQDGKQVPCMPSSDNAQGAAQHSMTDMQNSAPTMDTTQPAADTTTAPESMQNKEDAAMSGATSNPGAPTDNVNETTK